MGIKDKVMDSKVGQFILEKQVQDSIQESGFVGALKVLSKNEKIATKYLEIITQSEGFHQMATEYVKQMGEVSNSNNRSSDHLYDLFKETRKGLQTYLDNNSGELTIEEKMYIGEAILEIARMGTKLDEDNKSFLLKLAGVIGAPVAIVGVVVLAGLASNNQHELGYEEDEEEF